MSEKFTQGEWQRAMNKSRNGKGAIRGLSHCRIENEKGVVVAFAVPQKSRQEQIANTNLIAAAPEMYAKLKTVLALCEGNLLRKTRCDILGEEIATLLKKARGEE